MARTTKGRAPIRKTYKLYIAGNFPRSESGRYMPALDAKGDWYANVSRSSRKDFRNAVVAAAAAGSGWAARTGFNRGQILYRVAEMLEARRRGFEDELTHLTQMKASRAREVVDAAVDQWVWYAGWADKFTQLFSTVNPVAAPYFNFSTPNPTGVVALFAPVNAPLLGLVSAIAPIIVSGNTVVVIVTDPTPTLAVELAEVLATSDLPGGVVNILTGLRSELHTHVAKHMDVDAIAAYGLAHEERRVVDVESAENVKRVKHYEDPTLDAWENATTRSPYHILPFVEFKTAWHPIGM